MAVKFYVVIARYIPLLLFELLLFMYLFFILVIRT